MGRADSKGALRLAAATLLCSLVWACQAHHIPGSQEYSAFTWALSSALFVAGAYWVMYMALEPFVRRRWPQSLIAWARLLSNGPRDPLVCGHLLIGLALGVYLAIFFYAQHLFLEQRGIIPKLVRLDTLLGARGMVGVTAYCAEQSIGIAMVLFFLFFLLRALLKREWLAAVCFVGCSRCRPRWDPNRR